MIEVFKIIKGFDEVNGGEKFLQMNSLDHTGTELVATHLEIVHLQNGF